MCVCVCVCVCACVRACVRACVCVCSERFAIIDLNSYWAMYETAILFLHDVRRKCRIFPTNDAPAAGRSSVDQRTSAFGDATRNSSAYDVNGAATLRWRHDKHRRETAADLSPGQHRYDWYSQCNLSSLFIIKRVVISVFPLQRVCFVHGHFEWHTSSRVCRLLTNWYNNNNNKH